MSAWKDSTASRYKCSPQSKQTLPKATRNEIVYISGHACAEQDFVNGFLESVFGRLVSRYPYRRFELKERLFGSDPCILIFSPPLSTTDQDAMLKIWEIGRDAFPTVPILWLAPDARNMPTFLHFDMGPTKLLDTENSSDSWKRIIDSVAALTGIQPDFSFLLKER